MEDDSSSLVNLTSAIVGAFVGNNPTPQADLPALIATVHQALRTIDEPQVAAPAEPAKPTAAQIRKSITPDALISFEDGRSYKTLKRHLSIRGMTLADYKAEVGAPEDLSDHRAELQRHPLSDGEVRSAWVRSSSSRPRKRRRTAKTKPAAAGTRRAAAYAPVAARRGRPKKTPSKA